MNALSTILFILLLVSLWGLHWACLENYRIKNEKKSPPEKPYIKSKDYNEADEPTPF